MHGPDGNPGERHALAGGKIKMMISRRDALGSLPLALFFELAASAAHAQAQAQAIQPSPNTVFTHDLPNLTMDDWQVIASYVD